MGKSKIECPLLPDPLNVEYFLVKLGKSKGMKKRTAAQLKVRLQHLVQDPDILDKYRIMLICIGKEVQDCIKDLVSRRRVNLYELNNTITTKFSRVDLLRLNSDYLETEEWQRLYRFLSNLRRVIINHLKTLDIIKSCSLLDTLALTQQQKANQE